jgi:hypothetical protein
MQELLFVSCSYYMYILVLFSILNAFFVFSTAAVLAPHVRKPSVFTYSLEVMSEPVWCMSGAQ